MKIISITIAMILLSSPAMAMGEDAMKASPNPSPAAHAATTPQHPHHPAAVHKGKKHG